MSIGEPGYKCMQCGQWVMWNTFHSCNNYQIFGPPDPLWPWLTGFNPAQEKRIREIFREELERHSEEIARAIRREMGL